MEQSFISSHFNRHQLSNHLTIDKKHCLLTALTASLQAGCFIDSLETGLSKDAQHQLLAGIPRLKQETSIVEMLDFLKDEGERTAYAILLPHLISTGKPEELEAAIRKRFWGIELFIHRAHHIYLFLDAIDHEEALSIDQKDLKSGILAWDMGELITLSRIAHELGYIDENTTWDYIEFAGEQCLRTFNSWEEIGKSYLIGQAMKQCKQDELKSAMECFNLAVTDENSPWRNTHF